MAKKRVDVEIGIRNKIANGLKTVTASIRNFARGARQTLSSVGLSFKRLAAVGIGSFAALIRHGNSFRASMAEVKTMLNDDKTMLPELTKQVRELSSEFGLAKDTLAKGLYQALSAGVPANNAIDFLRVASKSAVGGVTDVKTAVDGLTSVLNAYAIDAAKVAQVSDIMFSVVKEGKINFEELSQNIGNIAPFAKVAGVGIEDLSAMIATLVKVDKPERAMTSLRQAMVFAAQSGKPLMQMLEEFEGKSLEDMLAAGVTQKSAAGIAIMSGNMKVLREQMEIFSNTAGAANAAFEDVSAVRGWQRLWQTVLAVVSQVGERLDTYLAPTIDKVTARIRELISSGKVDEWAGQAVEAVKKIGEYLAKFAEIAQQVIEMRMEIMWVALAAAIGKAGIAVAKFGTFVVASVKSAAAAKIAAAAASAAAAKAGATVEIAASAATAKAAAAAATAKSAASAASAATEAAAAAATKAASLVEIAAKTGSASAATAAALAVSAAADARIIAAGKVAAAEVASSKASIAASGAVAATATATAGKVAAAKLGIMGIIGSFMTLAGLGIASVFIASAVAVSYFAKSLLESNEAMLNLIKTQKELKSMDSSMKSQYGTRNASTMRKVRETMESGTDEEKAAAERLHPQLVAAWKGKKRQSVAAFDVVRKIGLGGGGGGPMANPGGIGKDTNMLSTSDLFTMMQAGAGAKQESELSELQEINKGIQDLIDVTGGVE